MHFELYSNTFPKFYDGEFRTIKIFNDPIFPHLSEIGFTPMFCGDKKCDCRRVLIKVLMLPHDTGDLLEIGTISYGWERMAFYKNWGPFLSKPMLTEFKGPALDTMQKRHPKYAKPALEKFIELIKSDTEYAKRFIRQYAFSKHKQGMKLPKDLSRKVSLNQPCPCKSEKPFVICCGKRRAFR